MLLLAGQLLEKLLAVVLLVLQSAHVSLAVGQLPVLFVKQILSLLQQQVLLGIGVLKL